MVETVLTLPDSLRSSLKEPLGPVETDAEELLAAASRPIIAVGDVVTAHLLSAGETPAVSLVDERTERTAVDDWVTETIETATGFDHTISVTNPPATLTVPLLLAVRAAVSGAGDARTLLCVDGEEDLAALPAVVCAPTGATVVYGQPGEGMVRATVDEETTALACDLLSQMDGDTALLWLLLGEQS